MWLGGSSPDSAKRFPLFDMARELPVQRIWIGFLPTGKYFNKYDLTGDPGDPCDPVEIRVSNVLSFALKREDVAILREVNRPNPAPLSCPCGEESKNGWKKDC